MSGINLMMTALKNLPQDEMNTPDDRLSTHNRLNGIHPVMTALKYLAQTERDTLEIMTALKYLLQIE